ncbi:hypothetical protein NC652_035872 [Populus alba x Populus x berolinensis]|nr:hypothetical protein NC652_035872 [Populus alba x Populus x berolinensis]
MAIMMFRDHNLLSRCKSIGQSAGRIWPPLCSPVVSLEADRNPHFEEKYWIPQEKAPDRITQAVESRGWSRSYYLLHFYEARQL